MEPQLTPLGKFVKWLLLPVLLAWAGYQFLAPNVGRLKFRPPVTVAAENPPEARTTAPIPPSRNEASKRPVRRPKKSPKPTEEDVTPPPTPEPEPEPV